MTEETWCDLCQALTPLTQTHLWTDGCMDSVLDQISNSGARELFSTNALWYTNQDAQQH